MSHIKNLVLSSITPLPSINPNVPAGATEIPIAPFALVTNGCPGQLHVFPGRLDEQRLRQSIQVLSSIVPTLSARFRYAPPSKHLPNGKFWFELTSEPIPFHTQESELKEPFPLSRESVIQDVSCEEYGVRLDDVKEATYNSNVHLCAFKLTTFAGNHSSLGISCAHVFADAGALAHVISLLSNIYQHGLDWRPEIYPTWDSGHTGLMDPPLIPPRDQWPAIFRSDIFYKPLTWEEMPAEAERNGFSVPSKQVSILLTRAEIEILKGACLAALDQNSRPRFFSSMDVISGWLASVLARGNGVEQKRICYAFNFRSVDLAPSTFVGDAVAPIEMDGSVPRAATASSTVQYTAHIAREIRETVNRMRTDKTLRMNLLRYTAQALVQAQHEKKQVNYFWGPDYLLINSYTSYEYALTFGFPADQCQAHGGATMVGIPRFYMANRVKGERVEDRKLQVCFMVPTEKYDKVMEVINEDRATLLKGKSVVNGFH